MIITEALVLKYYPISVVIPTRNSSKTLKKCLISLFLQNYPKDKIELIIVDAFSKDKTLEMARKFDAKILQNPRLSGEAGKAIGADAADNELILFLDSDNVLPTKDWLIHMVKPFQNERIIGSEPIYYNYCEKDPLIIRYCSLIGADDPLSIYLGFYGRYSFLKDKWSDFQIEATDRGEYFQIDLKKGKIPTMGANGFLIRTSALRKTNFRPYLFDIDIICDLVELNFTIFAKVKTSITHLYAFSLKQYFKKTYRRVRDFYYYHKLGLRRYPWLSSNRIKLLKFIFFTFLLFPLIQDAIKGYRRKPDVAWFLHWLLSFITILVYGIKTLISGFYSIKQH